MPKIEETEIQGQALKPLFMVSIMDGPKCEEYGHEKYGGKVELEPVATIPIYDLEMLVKDVRAQTNEKLKMDGKNYKVGQWRLTFGMGKPLEDHIPIIDICYNTIDKVMSAYSDETLKKNFKELEEQGISPGEKIEVYFHTLDTVSDDIIIEEDAQSEPGEVGDAQSEAIEAIEEDLATSCASFVPVAGKNSPNASRAIICPGQGTQVIGMAKKLLDGPGAETVTKLFSQASDVLGYDLLDVVMNGPDERLQSTEVSQPAVLVTSLAALATAEKSQVQCGAVAGFSLGEYTALVVSGALSLEDTLILLKVRSEAMQKACDATSGSMISVVGLEEDKLLEQLSAAKEATGCEVLEIANYLFPKGFTVSGNTEGCKWLEECLPGKGAMSAKIIKTAGAFHTSLMGEAKSDLIAAIEAAPFRVPEMPIYSNVTGEPMTTVDEIKERLSEQMTSSVKWHQTMENMLASGTESFLEPGPGSQLKSMMKRINTSVWKKTKAL